MTDTAVAQVTIDTAQDEDFAAIARIYAPYVLNTTVSMEQTPPTADEMKARAQASRAQALPFLVARVEGRVAGYAYAFPYRARPGYRFTVEESVYVADGLRGMGIGQQLLAELIARCREKNYRQMVAVIAGTNNTPSIKFHESMGFSISGTLKQVGFKLDTWVDTILMQKAL